MSTLTLKTAFFFKKKLTWTPRFTNSRISPISSLFLEIEAILFAVNRIKKGNRKNTRGKRKTQEISCFV